MHCSKMCMTCEASFGHMQMCLPDLFAVGSLNERQTQSLPSASTPAFMLRSCFPWAASSQWLNIVGTLRQASSYQMWDSFDLHLWLKDLPSACLIPSWIVLQSEILPIQTSPFSPSFIRVRPALPSENAHCLLWLSPLFPSLLYDPINLLHN